MVSWAEFETAAPDLATEGRRLIRARGDGEALLATVRGDGPPRIHPINADVVGDGLYAFLLPSAKRTDLEQDGRYALHTHQDPAAPDEFSVRGHARVVNDATVRARVADSWPFEVDDTYLLVELSVERAVLGLRGADEWPPRYRRWSATGS
jgi:pyridoxamine 5'-phosphate oxidase-like protein